MSRCAYTRGSVETRLCPIPNANQSYSITFSHEYSIPRRRFVFLRSHREIPVLKPGMFSGTVRLQRQPTQGMRGNVDNSKALLVL